MRRVAPIVFALLVLSLSLSAVGQDVGAKVYLEETDFNFGWIPSGATVNHNYVLYSRGTDSLKILKVKPG